MLSRLVGPLRIGVAFKILMPIGLGLLWQAAVFVAEGAIEKGFEQRVVKLKRLAEMFTASGKRFEALARLAIRAVGFTPLQPRGPKIAMQPRVLRVGLQGRFKFFR